MVQQKQGRVQPTMPMKGTVGVNDDKGLEQEAEVMDSKAAQLKETGQQALQKSITSPIIQKIADEKVSDTMIINSKPHPSSETPD